MRPISVVVNARLHSSRVVGKLTRPFGDSTLVEIALGKLARLDFFEHRFFAVAEEKLMQYAERYESVEILERDPKSVAMGINPPEVTFAHYIRVASEYIFVMNPCAAFLSVETVHRAYDKFQSTRFRSYLSAVPDRSWIFTADGLPVTHTEPRGPQATNFGRQYYRATHSFYIVSRDFFRDTGMLWTLERDDPHLVEMPPEEAYDIDTESDFEIASLLYRRVLGAA